MRDALQNMIGKKYRLKEREVKKVLHKGRPFFSYNLVINIWKNRLSYNRFAIVISGKSVSSAVERNAYRRAFYDSMRSRIFPWGRDIVCLIKSRTKLSRPDISPASILKEVDFIFDTKLWKNT